MRTIVLAATFLGVAACSQPAPPPAAAPENAAPADQQHAGITEPHGDHTPHHGGLVLMSGDVHYEVVVEPDGQYQVWFSDALREDLPASIASNVRVEVSRPEGPLEAVSLAIDESGEAWVGKGRPVAGDGVVIKVSYLLQGIPQEVEIPYMPPATS